MGYTNSEKRAKRSEKGGSLVLVACVAPASTDTAPNFPQCSHRFLPQRSRNQEGGDGRPAARSPFAPPNRSKTALSC